MAKKGSRYIQDITLNQPGELIQNVVNDWLNKNGYTLVTKKGETFYEGGDGIVTAHDYLSIAYTNGVFHIESWIKIYGKEVSVAESGLAGAAIKKGIKNRVDSLISYLSSQSYVESVTPQVQTNENTYNYSETVNVKSYENPNAGTAPLVVGIVVFCLDFILMFTKFTPGWLLILATIYGIVASCKAMKLSHNSGKSVAALVINILATVFSIGIVIFYIATGVLFALAVR